MKIQHNSVSLTTLGVLLAGLGLSGCGAVDDASTKPTNAPQEPAPPVVSHPPIAETCAQKVLGKVVNINGVEYCKHYLGLSYYDAMFPISNYNYSPIYAQYTFKGTVIPTLTQADLTGTSGENPWYQSYSRAWDTGLDVMPGDRLYYDGAGSWGRRDVNTSGWWIFKFTTVTSSCSDFTLDGRSKEDIADGVADPEVVTFEDGSVGGLMATDGSAMILIGATSRHVFQSPGRLKVGFNLPEEADAACAKLTIKKFYVERCENAAGETVACL